MPHPATVELPDEHAAKHAFCEHLFEELNAAWESVLDCQTVVIRGGRALGIPEGLAGEPLWNWLMEHGHESAARELAARQAAASLLSDFLQFQKYALLASAAGHTTVAFALLRKPLRDSLFLLEWLLADKKAFLDWLLHASLRDRDVPSVARTRGRAIVAAAHARVDADFPFRHELLYSMRFESGSPLDLTALSDQAIHIVTTRRGIETPSGDLNFVHPSHEGRLSEWGLLYFAVPTFLYYAVEIAAQLVVDFGGALPWSRLSRFRRQVLFLRCASAKPEDSLATLVNSLDEVDAQCPACNHLIHIDTAQLEAIGWAGGIVCGACQTFHDLEIQQDPKQAP